MIDVPRLALLSAAAALVTAGGAAHGGEVLEVESRVVSTRGAEIALAFRAGSGDARPIQAFLISVTYDPEAMEVVGFAPAGDWFSVTAPDFFVATGIRGGGEPGVAGLAVILDTTDDGAAKAIPPKPDGLPRQIAELRVLPLPGPDLWPPQSPRPIELTDGAARFGSGPPIVNSLVLRNQDHYSGSPTDPLVLVSGSIQILLRGDENGDGLLDIADIVYAINSQFLGGPPPPCPELADSNDDGVLDISDAVFLVNALFLGGPPPDEAGSCF